MQILFALLSHCYSWCSSKESPEFHTVLSRQSSQQTGIAAPEARGESQGDARRPTAASEVSCVYLPLASAADMRAKASVAGRVNHKMVFIK